MSHPRPTTLPSLRRELAHWCRKVWERGWVANHDGNLSCLAGGGRILATPTSFSKGEVTPQDLLVLDDKGRKLQGRWRPFSELSMHLACFAARDDAVAVVHAHPPTATGLSVAGVEVEPTLLAEAVVSLGDRIPTVPFAMPGSEPQLEQLAAIIRFYDAVVLERHGVLAIGQDLEQAYLRVELVEHLARIKLVAMQAGGVRRLTDHEVSVLLRKRRKAGLGPEARGVEGSPPF